MKNIIATTSIQTMKRMTTTLALGLAVLILAGTVPAIADNQVTRPYKSKGHVVVFVDLSILKGSGDWSDSMTWDGPPIFPYTASVSGEATHLGRYTGTNTGVADYIAGENNGSVVFVAANGDELLANWFETTPSGSGDGVISFIGGTGRFEGATGSAAQDQFNRVEYPYYDADLDILFTVIEYDEVVTGFITY